MRTPTLNPGELSSGASSVRERAQGAPPAAVATTSVCAIADTNVRLWGLQARERLRRQVAQVRELRWIDDPAQAGDGPIVIVRADYLFEVRTLKALAQQQDVALYCEADGRPAAVQVTHADRMQARQWLDDGRGEPLAALRKIVPGALSSFDATLRRAEPPLLAPVSADRREALESLLYGNAYKGITDLVTKWLWPRPARWGVKVCAGLGITPNAVTTFGALLVLGAGVAFWQGFYALGLAMGWFMTYLDTVDGKLARVTVQSSRFGHLLDHGMDVVHPPIWYLLWGASLSAFQPVLGIDLAGVEWLIIGGYVGGRLIEGVFDHALGCSAFAWRPFDAYFRLVTARRNPSLILLTGGVIWGRPDLGLFAVALWTGLSTAILALRMVQGAWVRMHSGALQSWLSDDGQAQHRYPRAFRTFASTQAAYRQR